MTFDDTVARRRAVTYPEAFSTAPGVEPAPVAAVTAAVFTVAACAPWLQNHAAGRAREQQDATTSDNPAAASRPAGARALIDLERSEFVF